MKMPRIFRMLKFARMVLAAYKEASNSLPRGYWPVVYKGKGKYCESTVETDARAYDAMNYLRSDIREAVYKCGFRKEVCS